MKFLYFLLAFIYCYVSPAHTHSYVGLQRHTLHLRRADLPEINMNISEIINYHGYPCENHEVVTADGYILTLQRIVHGRKNGNNGKQRPVALLQHGLLDSAHTWANNLPEQSLAFILADEGFEVWLGNSRGNTYSKRHVKLSPKSDEFWRFSWDEMAEYDLTASVDKILNVTGVKNISYVGHSQGTLISFAKLNENKEYASKINSFIALGPVATVGYLTSPIKYVAPFTKTLALVLDLFGHGEFLPSNALMKILARLVCEGIPTKLCDNIIFLLAGYDLKNTNQTRLPVYVSHTPAGTSVQNMVHFSQACLSKKFQKYNYGEKENMKKYGQKTAPLYSLNKTNVPTALFWGGQDWLADPKDVSLLAPQIKNLILNKGIVYYNHLDFVWGEDAHIVVYPDVVRIMKQYSAFH